MARKKVTQKKRAALSTKKNPARKTAPAKATDPAPVKAKAKTPKVPPEVKPKTIKVNTPFEPAKKKPKARGKFTLDEAIKWFKKNPHPEEFFCTDAPGFALAQGDHYLKFTKGQLVTSDPAEVEVLMRSRQFNLFIYAVNPVLRNLK